MDELSPNASGRSRSVNIALGLVILPAVFLVVSWPWLKESQWQRAVFLGSPVLCGVAAGGILSRLYSRSTAARIALFVVFSPVCWIVSLILSVVGCMMVTGMRS